MLHENSAVPWVKKRYALGVALVCLLLFGSSSFWSGPGAGSDASSALDQTALKLSAAAPATSTALAAPAAAPAAAAASASAKDGKTDELLRRDFGPLRTAKLKMSPDNCKSFDMVLKGKGAPKVAGNDGRTQCAPTLAIPDDPSR